MYAPRAHLRKGALRPRYSDYYYYYYYFATPLDVFQILIPAFFAQMYVPEKSEALYFVVTVLAGLGISVALLMPW